ncbi:hypothetical protein P879_01515 [Paragonimus westermani]|uniref:Uncharacterized protein n=1 Tax=Paragonimus westermani TaxID=34504 RepID=A0A8T0DL32_9TREM|nr:hypothetical protein P879_01515 [Paragonimus westermani]
MSNRSKPPSAESARLNERRRNWRNSQTCQSTRTAALIESERQVEGGQPNWWRATLSQFSREKSGHSVPTDSDKSVSSLKMRATASRRQSFLYRSGLTLEHATAHTQKEIADSTDRYAQSDYF